MLCFFFNDTATTEIYTLSLHDALPISQHIAQGGMHQMGRRMVGHNPFAAIPVHGCCDRVRSEEHTSELQSHSDLVCRLLLEKKKNNKI